jgi:Skp family chaperone for outer membrane proteins
MKRIAIFVMLAALSVALPIVAKAQSSGVADYERQSRESYKQWQKATKRYEKKQLKQLRKANKKQRKAMKKYAKAQRRAR